MLITFHLAYFCFIPDLTKTLRGQKRIRESELSAPPTTSTTTATATTATLSGSKMEDEAGGKKSTAPHPSSSSPSSSSSSQNPGKKKVRTTFTGRQIYQLEQKFENKKYLSSAERAEMAKVLEVTEQQVGHYTVIQLVITGTAGYIVAGQARNNLTFQNGSLRFASIFL